MHPLMLGLCIPMHVMTHPCAWVIMYPLVLGLHVPCILLPFNVEWVNMHPWLLGLHITISVITFPSRLGRNAPIDDGSAYTHYVKTFP